MHPRTTLVIYMIMLAFTSWMHAPRLSCFTHTTHAPRVIICDLDGVLLRTSRIGIAKHCIGSSACPLVQASLAGEDPVEKLYDLLEGMSTTQESEHVAYDQSGRALPQILSDWLAGEVGYDNTSIMQHMQREVSSMQVPYDEQRMYKDLIRAVCDSHMRSKHTHCLRKGYRLLTYLQRTFPECTFVILSNYDQEGFHAIYHAPQLRHLFARFYPEHIYISGEMKMVKPEQEIYYRVCDDLGVAPSECVLIDDQYINTAAAAQIGMHTHCFTGDIQQAIVAIENM